MVSYKTLFQICMSEITFRFCVKETKFFGFCFVYQSVMTDASSVSLKIILFGRFTVEFKKENVCVHGIWKKKFIFHTRFTIILIRTYVEGFAVSHTLTCFSPLFCFINLPFQNKSSHGLNLQSHYNALPHQIFDFSSVVYFQFQFWGTQIHKRRLK